MTQADDIIAIKDRLRTAQRILFITGAGISVESGLPTYRGVAGLYENDDPEEGMLIEQVMSGATFKANPSLTWKYLRRIEESRRIAEPNDGHRIIAGLEETRDVWVLTQNVDGLHHAAGSKNVIDVHGCANVLHCTQCDWNDWFDSYEGLADVPECEKCGAVIRPNVVLFDEYLDQGKMKALAIQLDRGFDAVFSIGTTSSFPYITRPVLLARQLGQLTVEVNPTETLLSEHVDYVIRTGAGEALTAIFKED